MMREVVINYKNNIIEGYLIQYIVIDSGLFAIVEIDDGKIEIYNINIVRFKYPNKVK